jgi:hypothetical protein
VRSNAVTVACSYDDGNLTTPTGPTAERADPADSSLVLGGPPYQLFLRSGLAKPPLELLRRRSSGVQSLATITVTEQPPCKTGRG